MSGIVVECAGALCRLTLDGPGKLNALDDEGANRRNCDGRG